MLQLSSKLPNYPIADSTLKQGVVRCGVYDFTIYQEVGIGRRSWLNHKQDDYYDDGYYNLNDKL